MKIEGIFLRKLISRNYVNFHGVVAGSDTYSDFDDAAYIACKEISRNSRFVTRSSETHFIQSIQPEDILTISGTAEHEKGSSAIVIDLVGWVDRGEQTDILVGKMKFIMVAVRKENGRFVKEPMK